MPEWLGAPLVAIVSSVATLIVAHRLGLGPAQAQYVTLLRGMNDSQRTRIGELEAENGRLTKRVEHLEEELHELQIELHRLRDRIAKRRAKKP